MSQEDTTSEDAYDLPAFRIPFLYCGHACNNEETLKIKAAIHWEYATFPLRATSLNEPYFLSLEGVCPEGDMLFDLRS